MQDQTRIYTANPGGKCGCGTAPQKTQLRFRVSMSSAPVKKSTVEEQDEAFCLSLSLDDRPRVLEELNRQGRILAGYPESVPLARNIVATAG